MSRSFVNARKPTKKRRSKPERSYISGFDRSERTDALSRLGFASYPDYLKSGLWESIRERVLGRDDHKCERCGGEATQVHHAAYDIATLRGECLDRLYSVCREHHKGSHRRGYAKKVCAMNDKEVARFNKNKEQAKYSTKSRDRKRIKRQKRLNNILSLKEKGYSYKRIGKLIKSGKIGQVGAGSESITI